jgi:hypothetical protein
MINALNQYITTTIRQSQHMKVRIEPSIARDQLSLQPTSSPPKKIPHTRQQIVVMECNDEDMEVDVTTQQDDESIKTKSDQFMEEQSETNFEHVFNHGPLHV